MEWKFYVTAALVFEQTAGDEEIPPCATMISAAATTLMTVATMAAAEWAVAAAFGLPMGGGGLGIGTIIVLGLVGYAFGIDPRILIGGAEILTGGNQAPTYQTDRKSGPAKTGAPKDEMGSMIAGVLGEIDDRWDEIFRERGQTYKGPRIVLFRNATNGGRCGMAQSAMGPFYCPPDKQIFLDTAFFRDVETKFRGCSGNACKFTTAYIIAHEAGPSHPEPARHPAAGDRGCRSRPAARRKPTRCRSRSNCRPIACPASGSIARKRNARASSSPATSRPRWPDTHRDLATTHCKRPESRRAGVVARQSFHPRLSPRHKRKHWFMTGYQQGSVQACNTLRRRVIMVSPRAAQRDRLPAGRVARYTNRSRAACTATRGPGARHGMRSGLHRMKSKLSGRANFAC
jgi:predicted metalloprotease